MVRWLCRDDAVVFTQETMAGRVATRGQGGVKAKRWVDTKDRDRMGGNSFV